MAHIEPVPTRRSIFPNLAVGLQSITDRLTAIGMLGIALTGGCLLVSFGFLFQLGIRVYDFTLGDDLIKEVGFVYAPNWMLVYMILFPLYLFVFGLVLRVT